MSLAERLAECVRACFTGLWIQSHGHSDAIMEIGQLCREQNGSWCRGISKAGCRPTTHLGVDCERGLSTGV